MMMCPKCGAKMPDDVGICSNCGEVLTSISSHIHGGDSMVLNMHHTSSITDNALLCMSYLGFLVIVPLMFCKNTKLARFHINQGLVLFITELAYGALFLFTRWLLLAISLWLSVIVAVMAVAGIVFIIYAAMGIAGVIRGETRELPVIGSCKIIK
ncbi:zinc-ribbon domain-containing protein [Oscillospiraceae bacterium LCP25S3_E10]|nr:zinc ribbon domain-containing protein [Ruminococcus sp.]MDD6447939.1 zinc ribbon domain-containing protein [Ruminococcus sp.]MDY2856294.1 zinc ribbon domain-containing protein [Oscillospiraceae bacterium]